VRFSNCLSQLCLSIFRDIDFGRDLKQAKALPAETVFVSAATKSGSSINSYGPPTFYPSFKGAQYRVCIDTLCVLLSLLACPSGWPDQMEHFRCHPTVCSAQSLSSSSTSTMPRWWPVLFPTHERSRGTVRLGALRHVLKFPSGHLGGNVNRKPPLKLISRSDCIRWGTIYERFFIR
jgi:hypothetical protein